MEIKASVNYFKYSSENRSKVFLVTCRLGCQCKDGSAPPPIQSYVFGLCCAETFRFSWKCGGFTLQIIIIKSLIPHRVST